MPAFADALYSAAWIFQGQKEKVRGQVSAIRQAMNELARPARAAVLSMELIDRAALANLSYWDASGGGYFLTADDADDVITRPKTIADNAQPAGNGTMAEVLARLFHLTGDATHRRRPAGGQSGPGQGLGQGGQGGGLRLPRDGLRFTHRRGGCLEERAG
ncbi:MAG TPA: hypothetical protein QF509_09065 [Rhodospirillales bacterium]|jgi:uncharacterized protein YyaL (SSP411 family)|nr:hypothetical protein [Rhodospirillales bacterium]